jgi:arabinogalactan endo-1,4-beta-galactosidase
MTKRYFHKTAHCQRIFIAIFRLFHTPTELANNLANTVALAKPAKANGYKFLLDCHYSDILADPQKQFIPKGRETCSHNRLVDSVNAYTLRTMLAFREAGAMANRVQVGIEISNGMLWPDGKLPANWANFAALLQAGIYGVRAIVLAGPNNHRVGLFW